MRSEIIFCAAIFSAASNFLFVETFGLNNIFIEQLSKSYKLYEGSLLFWAINIAAIMNYMRQPTVIQGCQLVLVTMPDNYNKLQVQKGHCWEIKYHQLHRDKHAF